MKRYTLATFVDISYLRVLNAARPAFLYYLATGLLLIGLRPLAAQTQATGARPLTVPARYVVTPFGYFDPACVAGLSKGDSFLRDLGVIRRANGNTDIVPTCASPRFNAKGEVISSNSGNRDIPQPSTNGYIVYESLVGNTSYGALNANITVPGVPSSNDGQTLYFFPGLEDHTADITILQPVLEWNGLTQNAWDIASWNCCYNNVMLHSSPVVVNSGDNILGTMQSTCQAGTPSCSSWNITTKDVTSGKSTVLSQTSSYGQTFNWALGGALEAYGIAQCSDFPPNSSTTFSNLMLSDYNFVAISPNWSLTNNSAGDSVQCNYGAQETASQITLIYGQPTAAAPYVTSSKWVYPSPVHHTIEFKITVADSTPGAVITYIFYDSSGNNLNSGTTTSGGTITSSAVGTSSSVSLVIGANATNYKFSGYSGMMQYSESNTQMGN
ncbi:hypothetical protein HDF16_005705 [Granulicella aggregans]|uniref:Uncharacterized protein n=1 Tax=Granulicella aggregans TaxID=474949 RepID=A0A7W7ZJB1_9BACT|nr:hypothetical protein [Granulicella aggregans]MBB5060969.1 hypothetical protein [Granulicella aggregans]